MYGTDGYLHQCSLDRDHVCSAMIAEFYGWNGLVWKVSEVRMTNVVLEVFDCWECRMCGGICMQGIYFFARLEIGFF
jgi:hypothetical protein